MIKKLISVLIIFCMFVFFSGAEECREEVSEHRTILLDKTTVNRGKCEVGILYSPLQDGAEARISAITSSGGSDSRKWTVTDLKLEVETERIRPQSTERFYVTRESLFRYPAAVVFGAIGAQVPVAGGTSANVIGKAGAAAALLLLVSQAKGEITGTKCVFALDQKRADAFRTNGGIIRIVTENREKHYKERLTVRIEPDDPIFKEEGLRDEGARVPE